MLVSALSVRVLKSTRSVCYVSSVIVEIYTFRCNNLMEWPTDLGIRYISTTNYRNNAASCLHVNDAWGVQMYTDKSLITPQVGDVDSKIQKLLRACGAQPIDMAILAPGDVLPYIKLICNITNQAQFVGGPNTISQQPPHLTLPILA
jgi:hypothetical protein